MKGPKSENDITKKQLKEQTQKNPIKWCVLTKAINLRRTNHTNKPILDLTMLPEIVPKDGPIKERVSIVENYSITLNGIINPDANYLKFEIVDQLGLFCKK